MIASDDSFPCSYNKVSTAVIKVPSGYKNSPQATSIVLSLGLTHILEGFLSQQQQSTINKILLKVPQGNSTRSTIKDTNGKKKKENCAANEKDWKAAGIKYNIKKKKGKENKQGKKTLQSPFAEIAEGKNGRNKFLQHGENIRRGFFSYLFNGALSSDHI